MVPAQFDRRWRAGGALTIAVLMLISVLCVGGIVLDARPAFADTTFQLTGGGWGHGVGMGQYGAFGMAQAGSSGSAIIQQFFTGTAIQGLAQPTGLRVQLHSAIGSTAVTGTGPVYYYVNNVGYGAGAPGQTVTITAAGDHIRIDAIDLPPGTLQVVYNGQPATVSTTGHKYRDGQLTVRLVSPTALQVVVSGLDMEHYLYGLAEVPSSWPAAALQAQALAGRSYAKFSIDSRRAADPNRTYDLDAGTADQVYAGDDKASGPSGSLWVAAVDATAGQVATYGGNTAQTFYSSSTGGYTENSEYVFVTAVPYLRAVPDPGDATSANPNHRWTRSFTGSELGAWVQSRFGVDTGAVTALDFSGPFGASGRIDRASVRLTGPNGSKTMTGNEFGAMIRTFAPTRALLSTLLFLDPFGQFDGLVIDPGGARFFGWTIDAKSSGPINVQAQIDGGPTVITLANTNRPDVGAAYPTDGPNHGFDAHVDLGPGTHTVCVTALGTGSNTGLGCRSITRSGRPIGQLDGFQRVPGGLKVQGWTLDPDTVNPIDVHVYVDGAFTTAATASGSRPDVASFYPAWGPNHGYDVTIPASAGHHTICTYGINVGSPDANPSLGCRAIDISGDPFGVVDAATRVPNTTSVQGWAVDPDTNASIDVHVYVDGQFAGAFHANGSRPDVSAAFPGYGSAHGFDATVAAPPGLHQVCVYGINNTPGNNPLIGCVYPNGSPVGNADTISTQTGGGLAVNGWALDPDTSAPITVHTYIDGQFNSIATANQSRPDVGAAYPGYGSNHGYSIGVPAGHHTVCVFGIDPNGGTNPGVGCLSY